MRPFNSLSPAEAERLALLIEECGEVITAATKILRHGYESFNPLEPGRGRLSNREALEKEIGHVDHAIHLMLTGGDINATKYMAASNAKSKTISRWLHHNPPIDEERSGKKR